MTNDTSVEARVTLGGRSACDVFTTNIKVKVSNNIDDTWQKPDVVCDVGKISVKMNKDDIEVVSISSFRFSDTFRRALPQEVSAYSNKRKIESKNFDEIVTGKCGTPLLERFELSFGDYMRVDFPPNLHLGKIIEDITSTEKSIKDGLVISGLIKKKPRCKKKYQLMDIHFTIPMMDANFLEARSFNQPSKFPRVMFGNDVHHSMINRWRFHIKNLTVLIKRNTPPYIIQGEYRMCLS